MGATKTLSASNVLRIAGASGKQYKEVPWHTARIVVRQFLPFQEYMAAIHNIAKYCSVNDEPAVELADFACRVGIITSYAFIELPEDFDTLYRIVYCSDLYDTVCSAANADQIRAIRKSVSALLYGEDPCV